MKSSKNSVDLETDEANEERDSNDESEDESEVLEESPCGRWQKRREPVTQRDVPGIDYAYLAMDTEDGVEVVWNEVQFSEKKSAKSRLDSIKQVFDNLIKLYHPNIVKFHQYWKDTQADKPRVIFITEYMSSGNLKQFLKKTKKNNKTLKVWRRWCTQILSALSYLHSCEPPVIHGNLTTDTIFIQHNGLIKIGCVAPDAISNHVKTYKEEARNFHYVAPEYAGPAPVTWAVDIYAFGICALEMAALEIPGNGETGTYVSEESIHKTVDSLEDPLQKDFILKCLDKDPRQRPTARELLFHAVLFEVPALKVLSAHAFVKHANVLPEAMTDEAYQSNFSPKNVIAEIVYSEAESVVFTVEQAHSLELEKFLEDVKNGVYPLTAFEPKDKAPDNRPRAISPELAESVKSETPEPADVETRMVLSTQCQCRQSAENPDNIAITILLKMDDKMNRQLTCEIAKKEEDAKMLAEELVHYGFINKADQTILSSAISNSLKAVDQSPIENSCTPSMSSPASLILGAA